MGTVSQRPQQMERQLSVVDTRLWEGATALGGGGGGGGGLIPSVTKG